MNRPTHSRRALRLFVTLLLGLVGALSWPDAALAARQKPELRKNSAGAPRPVLGQRTPRVRKASRPGAKRRWGRDPVLAAVLARPHATPQAALADRPAPPPRLSTPEREALEESLQDEVAPSAVPAVAPHPTALSFVWPVVGRLNSPFGPRRARFHTGIDIGAPPAHPVVAAADGRVLYARASRGAMGKAVVIEHADGMRTVYAHLSRINAREGKLVRQGDQVGAVGRTGRSTGPHLHFEIRDQGTPVAPIPLLPGEADRPESPEEEIATAPAAEPASPPMPEPASAVAPLDSTPTPESSS